MAARRAGLFGLGLFGLGALKLGVGGLAVLACAGCRFTTEYKSRFPPEDFRLELQYSEIDGGRAQVKRRALVLGNGYVILREADNSLRSNDGMVTLPVFQRLCVYILAERSIRQLSRGLHRDRAREIEQPIVPDLGGTIHEVELDLTADGHRIDVVIANRAVGLLNSVLRLVDAYLPEGHGFTPPGSMGQPRESRVQDVPPVKDSVQGALGYHQAWLEQYPDDQELLRDTFALACVARDWRVAERCLAGLTPLDAAERAAFEQILQRAGADR